MSIDNPKPYKESKVNKKLSDLTTKRVILIVLILLFILPLLSVDYYFDLPSPIGYATKSLAVLSESGGSTSEVKSLY
jgi:hypothetical protein